MKTKVISKKQIIMINIGAILVACILAIFSKALLPSALNIEDLNSIFVKLLGFPIVASLYFIAIYAHCSIVTQLFGKSAKLSNLQIGLRFGICFGLIFLIGMQEVMLNASPFSKWGFDYVKYEFFMGIGEAIVALLLCMFVAKSTIETKKPVKYLNENSTYNRVLMVGLIALTFTIERVLAYKTGVISSDISTSPIPCYGWTILFGLTLGCCYDILHPIFYEDKNPVSKSFKLVVITIGLSWTIYNSFIGWVIDGAMPQVLIRIGFDIVVFFTTVLIGTRYISKKKL